VCLDGSNVASLLVCCCSAAADKQGKVAKLAAGAGPSSQPPPTAQSPASPGPIGDSSPVVTAGGRLLDGDGQAAGPSRRQRRRLQRPQPAQPEPASRGFGRCVPLIGVMHCGWGCLHSTHVDRLVLCVGGNNVRGAGLPRGR
jgi:hypothetical protein